MLSKPSCFLLIVGLLAAPASAATVTAFYGDDDGFGVGETSGSLTSPNTSNAGVGEAAFTDIRLIGTGNLAPAFAPTGGFTPFVIPVGDIITAATLTMRTGAWVSGPNPVDGPNSILLDGLAVPTSFFDLFTNQTDLIETRSISLDPSFFAALADGSVSLNGTLSSENFGDESFQVDFLRLDIETAPAVPEPTSMALFGLTALGFGVGFRRRRNSEERR